MAGMMKQAVLTLADLRNEPMYDPYKGNDFLIIEMKNTVAFAVGDHLSVAEVKTYITHGTYVVNIRAPKK